MASVLNWEHKMLTDELTQGMEKALQLRLKLSASKAEDLLLQRIIATFENALYIIKWSTAPATSPETSSSLDGSLKCEDVNNSHGDSSKKRKLQPTWVEQVKVNSNALEGPKDDGYCWRKYGQKDILGAKYPRSYYRCTYRSGQNCCAKKQVQRSDEDPTLFEVSYKGNHTCCQSNNTVPPPLSPGKQESEIENTQYHQLEQQREKVQNFKANLRVETEGLQIQETPANFSFPSTFGSHEKENHHFPLYVVGDENHTGTNSPFFYSPANSEPNYFSAAPYQMANNWGVPDVSDIISANASTSNSPIGGGMEFSTDAGDNDPNFLFNILGFFT